MFRLKISSILNRINKVKLYLGLSSRKGDSPARGNASSAATSSKIRKKAADDLSIRASTDEIRTSNKAVKTYYKLAMDDEGKSLSFAWALNLRKQPKHKPIDFKRASIVSGSSKSKNMLPNSINKNPLRQRGGAELRYKDYRSVESEETPKSQEEEESQKNSTPNKALASGRQSGQNASDVKRRRDSMEKKEVYPSKSGRVCKDEIQTDSSNATPVKRRRREIEKGKMVLSKEDLICRNENSAKQELSCPQPVKETEKKETNFVSGAVLVCKNECEQIPNNAVLLKESQETLFKSKRKRKAQSIRNPQLEVNEVKPANVTTVKAEVNMEEDKKFSFQGALPCNDVIKSESTWDSTVEAVRSPIFVSESDFKLRRTEFAEDNDSALSSFIKHELEPFLFNEDGEEKAGQNYLLEVGPAIEGSRVNAASAANHSFLPESSLERRSPVEDEGEFHDAKFKVNDDFSMEGTLLHKDEITKELTNEAALDSTRSSRLWFSNSIAEEERAHTAAKAISHCSAEGPNESNQIGLGVTREELFEVVLENGLSIRAVDLAVRFRRQLETPEAQMAFLQLLKEHSNPEERNGEYYLQF